MQVFCADKGFLKLKGYFLKIPLTRVSLSVIIKHVVKPCGNSSVVEHNLAKVGVASSSLVFRSIKN